MRKIDIINKCTFLFEFIIVKIDGVAYKVKRGKRITVELPEGEYKMRVEQYFYSGTRNIVVEDNDIDLVITRWIPEYFYAVWFGVFILLGLLQFFSVINIRMSATSLLIIMLFIISAEIVRAKKYFHISDHYEKNQHRQ